MKGSAKGVVERIIMAIQDRAELVVTVTHGFARTLRDRGLTNVATVTNGVDLHTLDKLQPRPLKSDRLEVLYLGNHGESQRLDVPIKAAALVGKQMRLTMVGNGVQREGLMRLSQELNAPVEFHQPVHGPEVMGFYDRTDSCIVSLRDDWKSFETTIPSKTYEVLSLGRHITGIVLGEARKILEDAESGHVVASSPEDLAEIWKSLQADRSLLQVNGAGRAWVENNADVETLAQSYIDLLAEVAGGPHR
ncbi:glycosyltransferase involved in cell wall biosynthesis [Arthrobacter sp. CAN_A1]